MAKFGTKEVCDVTLFDLATGKPVLFFDTLKMSNIENNAEQTFAQGGKGNARLIGWEYNRTATFSMQDALIDVGSMAALSGTQVKKGKATVHARERVKADNDELEVKHTPIANTITVFKLVDGRMNEEVAGVSATGKTITGTGITDGEEYDVFYQFESGAETEVVVVDSGKFGGTYKIVGDTVVRNQVTGEDEPFQIVVEKAKMASAWSLTLEAEGDPSVFDMEMEVLKPDDGTEMIKFIKWTE